MKIAPQVLDLIGNTPLVKLNKIPKNIPSSIYAKLEFYNPSGSIKDRMVKYIIDSAEKEGLLKPKGVIIENSSGNTGTALAMLSAVRNYRCIITMPDKMSDEKKNLIRAFGAEVIITPTDVPFDSPESYYSVAKRLSTEIENAYYLDQYNNPKNSEAHYYSTGPEIWAQTEGRIDILVAGIGTGGTLSGAGRFLKEKNPKIQLIGVDPKGSIFYDYFKTKTLIKPSLYLLEGIGEDYLVKAIDFDIIDDIFQVSDKDSFLMTRQLAAREGLFVGGTSGSAVLIAIDIAKKQISPKNIVVILPDSGNRYLSKLYNDDWMQKKGFL